MELTRDEAYAYLIQAEAGWDYMGSWAQTFLKDMRQRLRAHEDLSPRQAEKLHELAASWSGPNPWRRTKARTLMRKTKRRG